MFLDKVNGFGIAHIPMHRIQVFTKHLNQGRSPATSSQYGKIRMFLHPFVVLPKSSQISIGRRTYTTVQTGHGYRVFAQYSTVPESVLWYGYSLKVTGIHYLMEGKIEQDEVFK